MRQSCCWTVSEKLSMCLFCRRQSLGRGAYDPCSGHMQAKVGHFVVVLDASLEVRSAVDMHGIL